VWGRFPQCPHEGMGRGNGRKRRRIIGGECWRGAVLRVTAVECMRSNKGKSLASTGFYVTSLHNGGGSLTIAPS